MRRTMILTAGLMIGGVLPLGLEAAPAGAAIPPSPPGCGFTAVSQGFEGAAGSEVVDVELVPLGASQRCTTTIPAGAAVVPASGTITSPVPVTRSITVAFDPARTDPMVQVQWTGHCTSPGVAGTFEVTVAGQEVGSAIEPEDCDEVNPDFASTLSVQVADQYYESIGLARSGSVGAYASLDAEGDVFSHDGTSAMLGQLTPAKPLDPAATALAVTPGGTGAWVAGTDGSVYTYGDAAFHGAATPYHPVAPVVAMAATPDGRGYWLVGADGGVFSFGDAAYHGSTGGIHLAAPIVGIAPTADGGGYWLAAADGGVFAFGDAAFDGSAGSAHLRSPIVGIAADPHGGYWLAASDGGVFAYGAPFHGSAGAADLVAPVAAIAATSDGGGYWLIGADGGIFTYGDAPYDGNFG